MFRKVLFMGFMAVLLLFAAAARANGVYPIVIQSGETKDFLGNVKDTFSRGELMLVEVVIQYPVGAQYYAGEQIQCLLIVEVWDPNGVVQFIGFARPTLSQGSTYTGGFGFKIPADAATGTWRIEVYVWNGFVAEKGEAWEAMADPWTIENGKAISFTVTG